MLARPAADTPSVIYRALALVSLLSCTLVCASFAMFARDQVAGASRHQASAHVAAVPSATKRPVATHRVEQPRRFIDGGAHQLTAPFESIVVSRNAWVTRGVPTLLALLFYGFGLRFLARLPQTAGAA